jgi:hypothetical protein
MQNDLDLTGKVALKRTFHYDARFALSPDLGPFAPPHARRWNGLHWGLKFLNT